MSTEKSTNIYTTIISLTHDAERNETAVIDFLRKKNTLSENKNVMDNLSRLIKSIIPNDKHSGFPLVELHNYLNNLYGIKDTIKTFEKFMTEENYIEVKQQLAIKKAERQAIWPLWRDKLARWFMGVSAAVILYSAFVALSNKWDFIKIPVRDMVVGG